MTSNQQTIIDDCGSRRIVLPSHQAMLVASQQQGQVLLANVLMAIFPRHREYLDNLKNRYTHDIERSDLVWRSLVESSSDLGGSRGTDLYENPDHYNKITFEALSCLSPAERLRVLGETIRAAKVRWPNRKTGWLAENVVRIQARGGPAAVRNELLSKTTREDMISFMKNFKGIGDKYARNIFMNFYHPQFLQSIAIDARVQSISKVLGLSFRHYVEEEQFYLDVARQAGLNGWELDRLIYRFKDEVLAGLRRHAAVGSEESAAAFCAR